MYEVTQAELDQADAEQRAERTAWHGQLMHDLLNTGVGIRRVIDQQVIAQSYRLVQTARDLNPRREPDLSVPYDRLSGAMRRNILLAEKLAEPRKPAAEPTAPSPEPGRHAALPAPPIPSEPRPATAPQERLDPRDRADRPDTIEFPDPDEEPDAPCEPAGLTRLYAAACRDLGMDVPRDEVSLQTIMEIVRSRQREHPPPD